MYGNCILLRIFLGFQSNSSWWHAVRYGYLAASMHVTWLWVIVWPWLWLVVGILRL